MKILLLILTCLLLSGCAQSMVIRQLSPINPAEPHATVTVCRMNNLYGYGSENVFKFDDKPLYRSAPGAYTTFTVSPGLHVISMATMYDAFTRLIEPEQQFQAEDGQAYYFRTDYNTIYVGNEGDLKKCRSAGYEFVPVQRGMDSGAK